MRRAWGLTLLIAALVVLSGCSGIGGSETATQSGDTATGTPGVTTAQADGSTPTASPEAEAGAATATATESPTATERPATPGDGQSLPPGVRRDGTVNETALAVAHIEATNTSNWRLRHRNENSTTLLVQADGTVYERTARGVTWVDGETTVTNETYLDIDYSSAHRHNTSLGSSDPRSSITFAIAIRLGTGDYEWVGTADVDGTELHELRLTSPKNAGSSVGYYTGTMLVDEDGRIHRLRGEVGESEAAADTYEFDYEWGVDGVPEPPWLDDVPRGVARKTADSTALNVTMTGGPAVPADTEFEFSHNGSRETVTLDEPLGPGDSLYVGLRESGDGERAVAASRERPTGGDLVDLRGTQTRLSATVSLDAGRVDLEFISGEIDF